MLIQANGTQVDQIRPKNNRRFTHREVEEILNCNRCTALRVGKKLMFIDTNAVRQGKRVNVQASEMAKKSLYEPSHYVAGNAFLVSYDQAPHRR